LASGGNFGSSETTNFCISSGGGDTTPPSNPTNLSVSNVTTNSADISWNASTDNVGVDGYNVYLNGGYIGSVAGTSATINGLTPATGYSVYVTAYDAASNESGASNTVNFTTLSEGGGGCTAGVLSSNSYESGWEGWSDGGSDCRRYSGSRSWDGSYSIEIRDNSGTASSTTSSSYDLSEFSSVDIEFYFYANSMENGEDFWVRYNDGSGWTTVASYAAGTSFTNGSFWTTTITLNSGSYNLSSNAQFRFQCDASANSDQIYIDLVTITGNCSALPEAGDGPIVTIEQVQTPDRYLSLGELDTEADLHDVKVYPNPARSELNLDIPADMVVRSVQLFSANGASLKFSPTTDNYETIDISGLNPGMYFLSIETDEGVINKRFIKL
ncbi:MAG: T9SS type A sorting domain-containing protein, partial [Saprospiraceae bacterium]|nr:T9SS type A sorting domain-containing protein [Saprospiraceae bacterium]MCB0625872.1 T9SS type A sorting domain-containing protein [Saprospiraceae bacterium]